MKGRNKWWLSLGVAAAAITLVSVAPASASHPGGDVPLLNAAGAAITSTEAYSPKATCGGCHNYGSGEHIATKQQGTIAADGKVYFQTYTVKSYEHGVSVGRHMNQGRNEDYSNAMRATFGDPFFTSSPGMWGKF